VAGFTPGGGNILAGKTSLSLADTGLTPTTTYYYILAATDSVAAVVDSACFQLPSNATLPDGVAGYGYSLTFTVGATTTPINICLEITPPPLKANVLKYKVGSGAQAGTEQPAPGSLLAQQIKGKARFAKTDYQYLQNNIRVWGTLNLTLAPDAAGSIGQFAIPAFLSELSISSINDGNIMEAEFAFEVPGGSVMA
jgi:hypothetical protein